MVTKYTKKKRTHYLVITECVRFFYAAGKIFDTFQTAKKR